MSDVKIIAEQLRQEIKKGQSEGALPEGKISVRIRRYKTERDVISIDLDYQRYDYYQRQAYSKAMSEYFRDFTRIYSDKISFFWG